MRFHIPILALLASILPHIASAEGDKTPKSGAEVYVHYCAACHAEGVLGAPRFGDRKAWRP